MGFRDWVADAPIGTFDDVTLRKDRIQRAQGFKKEEHPLTGVAATVESGEAIQSRITATRLLAVGVFAFAIPKKSGGQSYLILDGPDFAWAIEVDRKQRSKAVEFATKVNNQAKKVAAE